MNDLSPIKYFYQIKVISHHSNIMIIIPEHTHEDDVSQKVSTNYSSIHKPKTIECPQFLMQELEHSKKTLSLKSQNDIKTFVEFIENKVYSGQTQTQTEYLSAILEGNTSQANQQFITSLMEQKEKVILTKIEKSKLKVNEGERDSDKIKRIKSELDDKIKLMKNQLNGLNGLKTLQASEAFPGNENEHRDDHSNPLLQSFKKPSYWKNGQFHESTTKVREFLNRINQEKKSNQELFQKDLELRQSKLDQQESSYQAHLKQKKKKEYMEIIEKQYHAKARKRKQQFKEQSQRQKDVRMILQKYRDRLPVHVKYEKDFEKRQQLFQEQRKAILKEIKAQHPQYNPQEVDKHMQKYEEMREKYHQQRQKREEYLEETLQKQNRDLKELYHSDFHNSIKEDEKQLQRKLKNSSLLESRSRIMSYSQTVKDNFEPMVDLKKRKQLNETKRMLELSQDPKLRKVVKSNGQIEFEERKNPDSYEKGVNYLEELRELNKNGNRSRASTSKRYEETQSMMELSHRTKKIDYLRESRPLVKLKPTISDWKGLLLKKNYKEAEKYECIKSRAQSLENSSQLKFVQVRNLKKRSSAGKSSFSKSGDYQSEMMDLKQEGDQCLVESIAAKLVALKDVALK